MKNISEAHPKSQTLWLQLMQLSILHLLKMRKVKKNKSDDEEVDEQANLVESDVFNILLGGSYTYPPISELTIKE